MLTIGLLQKLHGFLPVSQPKVDQRDGVNRNVAVDPAPAGKPGLQSPGLFSVSGDGQGIAERAKGLRGASGKLDRPALLRNGLFEFTLLLIIKAQGPLAGREAGRDLQRGLQFPESIVVPSISRQPGGVG